MGKGGQFERHISTELSLWWSDGADDYIFWRSQGSGGRATRRGKGGRSTSGQYGDICAVKPIGEPLIDFLTLELKKGYSGWSIADVLDADVRKKHIQQTHEKWFQQTLEAWKASGSFSWLIFQQRSNRQTIVFMPYSLAVLLGMEGCWDTKPRPFATLNWKLKLVERKTPKSKTFITRGIDFKVCITTLREFLDCVSPDVIRKLAREV